MSEESEVTLKYIINKLYNRKSEVDGEAKRRISVIHFSFINYFKIN